MSNLNKSLYLLCNQHKNVAIPIPADRFTIIKWFLLCDSRLQGGNEFLASCLSTDNIDGKVFFNTKNCISLAVNDKCPRNSAS